jgi:hypothetical protein
MTYEEALRAATRDESFKATVYAMNTLLIHKGVYTQEQFEQLFTEWVRKEERKKARPRASTKTATFSSPSSRRAHAK